MEDACSNAGDVDQSDGSHIYISQTRHTPFFQGIAAVPGLFVSTFVHLFLPFDPSDFSLSLSLSLSLMLAS
jgi:hypothetical protein